MDKILQVKDLSFAYYDHQVLKGFSFDVERGSFISIMGPNGCGKSTLVKIISKVLKGYEGNISIAGKDIKTLSTKEVAKLVCVVPQQLHVGFNFSVRDMVMMGRFPYLSRFANETSKDIAFVDTIMEKTKISQFSDRRFEQLSGGERQRVIIAQALVQDSPLILLDEPTSHLDMNYQIELMELFLKINRDEGKTIVGVFHDINLAIQYSREMILIKEGNIVSMGGIDEVVTKENIKRVFHSDVYVGKNPFTNKTYISPTFTPSYDDSFKGDDKKIHIIGGGGSASFTMNTLYNLGYDITCGVVNSLDTDLNTAQLLQISYVSEAPFSPISLYSQGKNMEFIKASDVVILPDVEFGKGNFSNLIAVKEAAEMGKTVIILDSRDIAARDHTNGKAQTLYKKIDYPNVRHVKTIDEIVKILKDV